MADPGEAEILFERRGAVGLVTLNRPRALNALTLAMLRAMQAQLEAWAGDADVTRVILRGRGGRAFCAGGDIRQIHAFAQGGDHAAVDAFWRSEYRLDATVKQFAKPVISLIEGLVMGGGNGISVHGSHRVSSESYSFAMPEVGIGLFPDVGMTYALPRLPGLTGTYLALTGARIGPGDAHAVGLATHHAAAADFDAVVEALSTGEAVDTVLAAHARAVPEAEVLVTERGRIDACFSAETVPGILARLDADGSAFATETAALMRTRSPTSLVLVREQMRRGADLSFPQAMLTEYRMVSALMRGPDFFEGVRAALIDKDGAPAWNPATLERVAPGTIAEAFAPGAGPEPRFEITGGTHCAD
ncbi:enoyl-CoA hydratase/isomerase family protein [Methylobacterium sp. J-068]|uniref:enoyl-CoA hydratase/isomerase family protein n=1 Tax=Methylobacterium sp. J-068 TaxID=2836649 RepID=UPI001FBABBC0|nr:enoyl-CoA hydratase/isomerase family protein [Methylobacterium sp. J-068]MCJ2035259.1 enoyl-CoA hydratase/isomerase family protein [Methylobacterium sp. J-068]